MVHTKRKPIIDHGWSWMVLLATFAIQLIMAMIYCVGIFHVIFLEVYEKDRQTTAWLGAIQSSFLSLFAPLAGFCNQKFGPRITGLIGSFISSTGFFLTYFCTGYVYLVITFAVFVGVGNALIQTPAIVSIGFYFKQYRNLAYGIATSAVGLGTIVLPPIINYSYDVYGWRGCMLIMCGIYLHTMPAYALIRPQTIPDLAEVAINSEVDEVKPSTRNSNWAMTSSLQSLSSLTYGGRSQWTPRLSKKDVVKQTHLSSQSLMELRPKDSIYGAQCQRIQSHLHKDRLGNSNYNVPKCEVTQTNSYNIINTGSMNHFDEEKQNGTAMPTQHKNIGGSRKRVVVFDTSLVLLYVNLLFINASTFIVFVHFPSYFYSQGMTSSEMAVLMTLIGCCSFVCRILVGALTNNEQISVLMIYISGGGLTSIFIMLCPILSHTPTGRVIFAIGIGFYGNTSNGLMAPLTLTLCPLEDLSMAYMIELVACGISGLLGPPFAGGMYTVGSMLLMLIPVIGHSSVLVNQSSVLRPDGKIPDDANVSRDIKTQNISENGKLTENVRTLDSVKVVEGTKTVEDTEIIDGIKANNI